MLRIVVLAVGGSYSKNSNNCPFLELTAPLSLEVTGLEPLPATIREWGRALVEPVLARVFEEHGQPTADEKEVGDDEAAR